MRATLARVLVFTSKKVFENRRFWTRGRVRWADVEILFFAVTARRNPQHIPRKNLTISIYKFIIKL